ncbi:MULTISPECIES: aldo/keto reductase [Microbacterium]|uniref:aldo/keto reductase n=1 Tax=Microbacterium TaxID=33882 RepID=UPI00217DA102|nr:MULTISPECIES: aldo/keto reductase [Microbacterium]UWF77320.1 aldo/keto reductase [Microbacterium neungamense]WCM55479.1 aldo/keto reductase [Microbacterium sp. EF45047]
MSIRFPHGPVVPEIGIGTWFVGDDPARRDEEIAAIRAGLDAGLTVIDTAEMYGGGRSERLVGEAIAGRRDEVFLVSKVLPSHADAAGVRRAAQASLERLGTDRLDLYLLHWRGAVPFDETVAAFERLRADGDILAWGVSNLDPDDLAELPAGAATDQVLYNPIRRGPEIDLLPLLHAQGIPAMAYSPLEQARLLDDPGLAELAASVDLSPAQLVLAWVVRSGEVLAIPKAGSVAHARENAAALGVALPDDVLDEIDRRFPAPRHPVPLEML